MNRYRKPCNSCQQPQVSPQQTEWFQPPFEPIVCPPRYRVHDSFIPRMQPVIHPTVNVNREHVFPVPQHFFPQVTRNEVANQGFQQATPYMNQYQQGAFQQQPYQQQQQQFFPGQR